MSLLNLSFVLRLVALCIEHRSDGIGIGRLHPVIGAEVHKSPVVASEVLVHTSRKKPLVRLISGGRLKLQRARRCRGSCSQSRTGTPTVASKLAVGIGSD